MAQKQIYMEEQIKFRRGKAKQGNTKQGRARQGKTGWLTLEGLGGLGPLKEFTRPTTGADLDRFDFRNIPPAGLPAYAHPTKKKAHRIHTGGK